MTQTSSAINWPWVLRARADASYLDDTEGTVNLLRQVADYIETITPPPALANTQGGDNSGYVEAFYKISEVMGIPAQTSTPKEVFENEMLPRLQAAFALTQGGVKGWTQQDAERENVAFHKWWEENGYENHPEHYSLTCKNAMHAAWQEASRCARRTRKYQPASWQMAVQARIDSIRNHYEAIDKPLDCKNTNSTLDYGRVQGLEIALELSSTTLAHQPVTAGLPQDVIDLVIAARIVAFEDQSPEALQALDKASEAFAERVPWDNDPAALKGKTS